MSLQQMTDKPKPNMDCINLLTSILLCYPEISLVSFEPANEEVAITYTFNTVLTDEECAALKELLTDGLDTYHFLEKIDSKVLDITAEIEENMTLIQINRDILSFTHGELRLMDSLIKEHYRDFLWDEEDRLPVVDKSMLMQSEMIDTMLGNIKINPIVEAMIGIRENGRVIVFNK